MSTSAAPARGFDTELFAPDGASATVDGACLSIRSPSGQVLFEYHAEARARCVVFAPGGDLELRAERGRIALSASEGISIETERELCLNAGDVVLSAQRVRSVVGTLIERLGSAYREIEGLSQTRAGRIRTIARGALQMLGERAVLKAEHDVKVKGSHVHLG